MSEGGAVLSFYTEDTTAVLNKLKSSLNGLSSSEAQERLSRDKKNTIRQEQKTSYVYNLVSQLLEPMTSLLIGIAGITAVWEILSGEYPSEFLVILGIILLNAVVVVSRNSRSDKKLNEVLERTKCTCAVIRNGVPIEINSEDIVVGDVVILSPSTVIPADMRIIEANDLRVEQSKITGRKEVENKYAGTILGITDAELNISSRNNTVYMGSRVVSGSGKGVVTATGLNTQLGHSFDVVSNAKKNKTPLQINFYNLNVRINTVVMGLCLLILITQFIYSAVLDENLTFVEILDEICVVLALAITAMPKNLSATVGICISDAVSRLLKNDVYVLDTDKMEVLGSVQVLIIDEEHIPDFDKLSRKKRKELVLKLRDAEIIPILFTTSPFEKSVKPAMGSKLVFSENEILTGEALNAMSDKDFASSFRNYRLYCDVTKAQKARIVNAWTESDFTTVFAGNAESDVLAAAGASVSITVDGKKEKISKSCADIIMTNGSVNSLLDCIETGRRLFGNIQKLMIFTLSVTIAQLAAVIVATAMNVTIIGSIHILWINLIASGIMSLALCVDTFDDKRMQRKTKGLKDNMFSGGVWIDFLVPGTVMTLLTVLSYYTGQISSTGVWRFFSVAAETGDSGTSMAFLTISSCFIVCANISRSRYTSIFDNQHKQGRNVGLIVSGACVFVVTSLITQVPVLASVFELSPVSWPLYAYSVALSLILVPVSELIKLHRRRKLNSSASALADNDSIVAG